MIKKKKKSIKKIKVKSKALNNLYHGDNLDNLRQFIKDESVDLCYIDPPFNSNRTYNQLYLNQGKEDKAQAQAFVDTWEWDNAAIKGYEEIIANEKNRFTTKTILLIEGLAKVLGKDSMLSYLVHITIRVTEIHRVLKPTGSFYLHCDPTASHYLKLILDAIFIENGGEFITEIIWTYSWGVRTDKRWNRKHDVIFCYSKSKEYTFNAYEVLEPRTLSESSKNRLRYAGALIETRNKTGSTEFALPSDVWYIPTINGMAKERLGYPTQKPEKLLEQIIKASSNKGDVVLDAYCGCGTTVAVAERLGRKWIGIDITYQSISLILWRMERTFGKTILENIELTGVPRDWEGARALAEKKEDKLRKEFEKWAVLFYTNNRGRINEKKGGDGGIDGIALIQERNEKSEIENKKIIFSVKSDKVLTPAYINQLKGKMHDEGVVMGIFICLYDPTAGMLREAKEMGTYKNNLFGMEYPKLQIVTVREIFEQAKRLTIPVLEMVKKAIYKGKEDDNQTSMVSDFEEKYLTTIKN